MIYDVRTRSINAILHDIRANIITAQVLWQRNLRWTKPMKKKLIRSLVERMPFGMITLVKRDRIMIVLDGKQRLNAITTFINNEYPDEHGVYYRDWDTRDQRDFCRDQKVCVQEITLEEGEGMSEIVNLFRLLNTQGKKLSDGELFGSCFHNRMVKLACQLFNLGPFRQEVVESVAVDTGGGGGGDDPDFPQLQTKWSKAFNPRDVFTKRATVAFLKNLLSEHNMIMTGKYADILDRVNAGTITRELLHTHLLEINSAEIPIKELDNKGELAFFIPLVVSGVTGNLDAISTSFGVVYNNGLTDSPTYEGINLLKGRLHHLLRFIEGETTRYFGRPTNGYPVFSKLAAVWAILIEASKEEEEEEEDKVIQEKANMLCGGGEFEPLYRFYNNIHVNDELKDEADKHRRKNMNKRSLHAQIEFMARNCS